MVIFIAEQPPGLGRQRRPRFRRSEVTKATSEMVGGGGGKEEVSRGREPPLVYVIALPAAAPPAVVSRLEGAVPRKARSCLPRAAPSAWWSGKIPVVRPPPPAKNPAEEVRAPRPQSVRVAPSPDPATASPAKKPAKRARRCLHCDAAEAPQWRSRPMERSTLCNACGVLYRAMGALREHRPAARPVAEPLPESHIPASPQESPIWEPEVSPAIYLVRKPSKLRRPPRKEAPPVPPPRRSTKGSRSCLHCGSSKTPQWREGPMGHGTLCNACGVRYRQGRLLPEYRPIASPTFVPSEHANTHRRVLELRRHRHRQSKEPHPPSPPPQPVDSHIDPPIADDHPTDAPGSGDDLIDVPTSLDSLLLDGPSAPLIVDGDEFLIS